MRIKRKVSISCLGGRLGICLLLAFAFVKNHKQDGKSHEHPEYQA